MLQDCWAQDPGKRPTFKDVADRLKALQRWERTGRKLRVQVLAGMAANAMASTAKTSANEATPAAAVAAGATAAAVVPTGEAKLHSPLTHGCGCWKMHSVGLSYGYAWLTITAIALSLLMMMVSHQQCFKVLLFMA